VNEFVRKFNLLFFGLLTGIVLVSCKSSIDQNTEDADEALFLVPPTFQKCLQYHGFNVWKDLNGLEFSTDSENGREHHIIDLVSRNTCVIGDTYSILRNKEGFFVSPSLEAYDGDPVFYHNVNFYFVGMPFVFTDSGVEYETMGDYELSDTIYHGIQIQFESGVGVADQDRYIVLVDKNTYAMRYLLFTMTYFDQKKSQQWYAKRFDNFKKISGIRLPTRMTSFYYKDHQLSNPIETTVISGLELSFEPYPTYTFEVKEPSEQFIQ
jgi:hypothetical protein